MYLNVLRVLALTPPAYPGIHYRPGALRPRHYVDIKSVFKAANQWHKRLGPLDTLTAAIVEGRLNMP